MVSTRFTLDTYSGTVPDFAVSGRTIVMRYQSSSMIVKIAPLPVKTPAVVLLGESGGSAQSGIYSGEFSRSERFVKLRPSTGKPVADIDCNDVEVVVWELLSGQSRVKENITGFRDA